MYHIIRRVITADNIAIAVSCVPLAILHLYIGWRVSALYGWGEMTFPVSLIVNPIFFFFSAAVTCTGKWICVILQSDSINIFVPYMIRHYRCSIHISQTSSKTIVHYAFRIFVIFFYVPKNGYLQIRQWNVLLSSFRCFRQGFTSKMFVPTAFQ